MLQECQVRRDQLAEELQVDLQGLCCAEQQGSRPRADRRPVAEDHGGQRNEAAPIGHQRLKGRDRFEREVGACQPGEQPADDDIGVAHEVHIDADRVRGSGMLTHGTRPQAPACIEQDIAGDKDQHNGRDGNRFLVEDFVERFADGEAGAGVGAAPALEQFSDGNMQAGRTPGACGTCPPKTLPFSKNNWRLRKPVIPMARMLMTVPPMI